MTTWELVKNETLSLRQRLFFAWKAFQCKSLVFIANDSNDEFVPFGVINDKNENQALACLTAFNEKGIS